MSQTLEAFYLSVYVPNNIAIRLMQRNVVFIDMATPRPVQKPQSRKSSDEWPRYAAQWGSELLAHKNQ
jgi:hypothetical protein